MATVYRVGNQSNAFFGERAIWSGGAVPGASDDAYLTGDGYRILLNFEHALGSLSILGNAQLTLLSPLTLADASVSRGLLEVVGTTLTLGATLLNLGTIRGDRDEFMNRPAVIDGGSVINLGLIRGDGPTMIVRADLDNDAGGVVRAIIPNRFSRNVIQLQGDVANDGLIDAAGGIVTMVAGDTPGVLANLSDGALNGGTWRAAGGGSIVLAGLAPTRLAGGAVVTLDGASSAIRFSVRGEERSLDETLRTVDAGSALHILGGRSYTAQQLEIAGLVELGGGTLTADDLILAPGGRLEGAGVLAGVADLRGTVAATGTLVFTGRTSVFGALTGEGRVELAGDRGEILAGEVTVAALAVTGATRVAAALDYAGALSVTGTTLDVRAGVRLTGSLDLDDGVLAGTQRVTLTRAEVTSTGSSRIETALVNAGRLEIEDGTLSILGKVGGRGTLAIGDGATLDLGRLATVAGRQTISFADGAATLSIDAPGRLKGALAAFGADDAIDLAGVSPAAGLRWVQDADGVGGLLRIFAGTTITLRFADGVHAARDFALADDGAGGARVTLRAGAAAPAALDPAAVFDASGPQGGDHVAWHVPAPFADLVAI